MKITRLFYIKKNNFKQLHSYSTTNKILAQFYSRSYVYLQGLEKRLKHKD